MLSGTMLASVPDRLFRGYSVAAVPSTQGRPGQGLLLAVRHSLRYHVQKHTSEDTALWVRLHPTAGPQHPLLIRTWYLVPQGSPQLQQFSVATRLDSVAETALASANCPLLLGGDFNAHLGHHQGSTISGPGQTTYPSTCICRWTFCLQTSPRALARLCHIGAGSLQPGLLTPLGLPSPSLCSSPLLQPMRRMLPTAPASSRLLLDQQPQTQAWASAIPALASPCPALHTSPSSMQSAGSASSSSGQPQTAISSSLTGRTMPLSGPSAVPISVRGLQPCWTAGACSPMTSGGVYEPPTAAGLSSAERAIMGHLHAEGVRCQPAASPGIARLCLPSA